MSRKNEESRMILPKGWKYITVLDFEVGKVFQYRYSLGRDFEEYLTLRGHNLKNCEWMIHDSSEIITN